MPKTTNRVTPRLKTIRVPDANWISLDIGIWPNPGYPHMTIMAYYQFTPGQWRPPAATIDLWDKALAAMKDLWAEFECQCGEQCKACSACGGTNWKDYARWKEAGGRMNAEGYPVFDF